MKRVLITLAAAVLLTMAVGVATAYGGGPIAPPTTGTENTYQGASAPASVPVTSPGQSQAPAQSNTAQNDQLSLVGEAQNVQTGLNNNTVQVGEAPRDGGVITTSTTPAVDNGGNESNGNTNTVGDQTAVNGNNAQQSNDTQRSGGACCEKSDSHSQPAGQQNSAHSEQGAIVVGGTNVQTGLNNNTVQVGSHNESNNNTNTAGDQTAVNGNNLQQSNESTSSSKKDSWKGGEPKRYGCNSKCEPRKPTYDKKCSCVDHSSSNESNGNTNTVGDQTAVNGNNFQQSNTGSGGQQNQARNEQGSIVAGVANIQTGLNNNTVQLGGIGKAPAPPPVAGFGRTPTNGGGNGGIESNHNTNTVGDQTAVNGNNFQQSNAGSGGQQNSARNEQLSFVLGATNVQTGLNNNTVQLGQTQRVIAESLTRSPSYGGGGKESNGNTNTAGDQTAVNGNNFQQSNEGTASNGYWKSRRSSGGQSNYAKSHQGAIVIGGTNIQTGLNNNTVQLGGHNESNGNTNTVGDQTAVNGNNFQQSNESNGSSNYGSWKGGEPKGCYSRCEQQQPKCYDRGDPRRCEPNPCDKRDYGKPGYHKPDGRTPEQADQSNRASNKQGSIVIGGLNVQTGLNNNTVQLGGHNESNGNTNTVGDQTAVNGNNFQQSNESNGSSNYGSWKGGEPKACYSRCEQQQPKCYDRWEPKRCEPNPCDKRDYGKPGYHKPDGRTPEQADQSNRASNKQGSIVIGGLNVQTGLNNNTVQLGGHNESSGNTNTVGDQTAVNGNNFQQSNESNGSDGGQSNTAYGRKGGDYGSSKCESKCDSRCEYKCDGHDGNKQGAIVIGGVNVQTGLNNNTVQIGGDNKSKHKTNTPAD